ncbi:MAG TPA: hypothetical protein VFJ15_00650 [Oleiagrimonas sp.]|nr:hypothetical protein [Oleiagrimonas sp.]
MAIDPYTIALRRRARVRLALAWLAAGTALLLLTPVSAWSPTLGWAPLLALVVSPLLIALALDPVLPLRLLATRARQRRRSG